MIEKIEIRKEKPECKVCYINKQYHGERGCLRARTEGGPENCISFARSTYDRKNRNKKF